MSTSAQKPAKFLIITGDDFGLSHGANTAILRAHRDGVLTAASLMVTGDAAEEAISIAKAHPSLGVGLHLVLTQGRSALPPSRIPGLVDDSGAFLKNPVCAGLRYYFESGLRPQLEAEITAQIERFLKSSLPLDHINGHLNLHLHPVVLDILLDLSTRYPIKSVRCAREPFWITLLHDPTHLGYKLSHAMIFRWLSARARTRASSRGIACNDRLHGLLETGAMTERYLIKIIERIRPGITEIYVHPGTGDCSEQARRMPGYRHAEETAALTSSAVRDAVARSGAVLSTFAGAFKTVGK